VLSVSALSHNQSYAILRDAAVEAAAQRGLAAEKDAEARRQVSRTEKVEAALRQVRTCHNYSLLGTALSRVY
jgi:hypothetical protein